MLAGCSVENNVKVAPVWCGGKLMSLGKKKIEYQFAYRFFVGHRGAPSFTTILRMVTRRSDNGGYRLHLMIWESCWFVSDLIINFCEQWRRHCQMMAVHIDVPTMTLVDGEWYSLKMWYENYWKCFSTFWMTSLNYPFPRKKSLWLDSKEALELRKIWENTFRLPLT